MAPQSVQLFLQGLRSCPTQRPCYSVCSNRPHLATAVMHSKKYCRKCCRTCNG